MTEAAFDTLDFDTWDDFREHLLTLGYEEGSPRERRYAGCPACHQEAQTARPFSHAGLAAYVVVCVCPCGHFEMMGEQP